MFGEILRYTLVEHLSGIYSGRPTFSSSDYVLRHPCVKDVVTW